MRSRGFTLIELLVVVAIIAILASIAIPQFGQYRRNAAIAACKADLRVALNACVAYLVSNPTAADCSGQYPTSTPNVSSITITLNPDGSISGNATCAGAASGVTCNINTSTGVVTINCSG